MKLIHFKTEYPCVKAVKNEAAGTIDAYAEDGSFVFRARKVKDFSQYTLVDGEWSEDETQAQLDRVEAQAAYTAMMTDTLLEV